VTGKVPELRDVVDLACLVMQRDAVSVWLRTPNSELDNRQPLDLIAEGKSTKVIALLLAVAEGVIA